MEIYIETFILQNVLINFCLLKLIYLTTKPKTSFLKMIVACLIGSFSSVIIIMFLNNVFILNLCKFITATIMLILAFKQSKKHFIFNFILLFLYTYAFGGIISSFGATQYFGTFGTVTTSKFSLEFICIVFIIFTYIFELVVKQLKLKIKTNSLVYNLTLTLNDNSIKINAYLDTGNFINYNGQPVLILDINSYLKLTKMNLIEFLSTKSNEIKTATVNGNNSLKLVQIDTLELNINKTNIKLDKPYVAINTNNCFKNTNYQALLSPLFL